MLGTRSLRRRDIEDAAGTLQCKTVFIQHSGICVLVTDGSDTGIL